MDWKCGDNDKRRTYYDAEPWYQREKSANWYQQNSISNKAIKAILKDLVAEQQCVMEIGCGGGWLAEFVLSLGVKKYFGFDFSETFTDDKDGNLRTVPWSMGAYEYD